MKWPLRAWRADRVKTPGKTGAAALSGGTLPEVGGQGRGAAAGGRVAPPDLCFDLLPDALAPAFQGVETGAARMPAVAGTVPFYIPRSDISSRMILLAFSPTMIAGPLMLPDGMVGKTEASATRIPSRPCTLSLASTTFDFRSGPIRQVLAG